MVMGMGIISYLDLSNYRNICIPDNSRCNDAKNTIMYAKVYLVVLWVILAIVGLNVGLHFLSMPSTMFNIFGVFIIVTVIVLSISTKCLTKIVSKRK